MDAAKHSKQGRPIPYDFTDLTLLTDKSGNPFGTSSIHLAFRIASLRAVLSEQVAISRIWLS
ncbi:hypothetical protein AVDCRST_MAG81-2900 [uncultured Synechococcales cyanobacterium]|uniref:Uncharacterized protein n=1 Tax=uncultured Synechococcales cyanobacterium TaxID=1936017 RepID=A0A6J4VNN2_9CYAN|nr:hypothetical protein AVDCRST_MAG81-2900 [uncultured Synechococcales cyanobacterium]